MKTSIRISFAVLFAVSLATGCKKDKDDSPGIAPPATVERGPLSLTFTIDVGNCSSVAYNPAKNLYYTVRSGANAYPLQTFSSTGEAVSQALSNGDFRGMWWNNLTGQLEMNYYNTTGWATVTLNSAGYATNGVTTVFTGQHQPDIQSIGAFDDTHNQLLFYKSGKVYQYDRTSGNPVDTLELSGIDMVNTNKNEIGYTGVSGYEIALLDWSAKKILFFNSSTGVYAAATQLPEATVTSQQFNFSYANGFAWILNPADDTWSSYKIF